MTEVKKSRNQNVYWNDIQSGTFVLVQFASESGNLIYRYVCSILKKDEDDGEVTVQGLRLMNSDGNEFSNVDDKDVSNVPFEAILEVLEDPQIVLKKRKIIYKFNREINVYEK